VPLEPHGTAERAKTWQASPLVRPAGKGQFHVAMLNDPANSRSGQYHAAMGFGQRAEALSVKVGARAMLSQQVRNPMAGRFTFSVHACGAGSTGDFYREVFLKHFACRLVIFAFLDLKKNHTEHRQFASVEFEPPWSESGKPNYERFEVSVTLRSQDGGANETNLGIGVAVMVEKKTPGAVALPPGGEAFLRIDDVELVFNASPRKDDVVI